MNVVDCVYKFLLFLINMKLVPNFLRRRYSFSQDELNEIYERVADILIAGSDNYVALYLSARENNDTETAELALGYVMKAMQSLGQTRTALKTGMYPITSDLVQKVEDQIKKLAYHGVHSVES